MSCYSKEKCGVEKYDYNNICKSHSARSDREKSSALTSTELYRICPSKLSKRELEDLYFALLENNLELKRTINGQQDKIRGLSTKVQRLNASQKLIQSKEMKDCCIGTKTLVNDQKESILDLKRTNQRMSERIRTLNMRLCSAKQFHKKSPSSSVSRCLRCANTSALPQHTYVKHSCSPKPSEPTNQTMKCSVSCQNVDRDATSVRSAQTEPREPQCQNSDLPCDENKCRTVMEELKQKIVTLQEELSNTHSEYSSRISRLEGEVSAVRRENVRVRGERGAGQDQLRGAAQRAAQLLDTCRQAEAKCVQLTAQLSIEKRKVAELETRLKAANMSNRVNKAIKDHFAHKNSGQKKTCDCDLDFESIIVTPAKISAQKSPRTDRGLPANKALEVEYLQKMNEQLMKTILDLQSQVDRMRIAGAKLAAGTCSAKKCGSKAAEGKSEDDAENCATNCGDDSPGCTMPIVESSKRQMEPQNENQFTPSINRSVEDYAPNKKVRQSETPSTSELEYGLQQEMQAAEQAAKPQSTNESFEKNRLFESLNYAAKVNVKPEFYTVDDRQQQLAGKKKVSTPQCLRCTRGAEFIADTDLLADKDSCEPCEFCSIEKKECQSKPPRDKGGKSDGGVAKGPAKSDRHNSLQIPGPIPVAEATTKDWKKNVFKRFSLDGKKKDPQKSKDEKRKRERDIENTTQRRGSGNMKDNADINNSLTNKMPLEIDENAKALREARRELKAHSKESFELNRLSTLKKKDSQTMPLPIQESLNNFYPRSDLNLFPTVGAEPNPRPTKYGNQTYHALTFQETNLQEQNRATQVGQENKQRRRSSTSDQETYTVDTSKETRATSPDNTEYEISYMTDLPSEREGKSPKSQRLSPGEDKMTTTYTDSYTNPATNYSLSEGELPATTTRKLSLNSRRDPAPLTNEDAPPTQKMEEALQAITEELARCKNLMLSQRPTDATSEATRTEATKPEVTTTTLPSHVAYLRYKTFTL